MLECPPFTSWLLVDTIPHPLKILRNAEHNYTALSKKGFVVSHGNAISLLYLATDARSRGLWTTAGNTWASRSPDSAGLVSWSDSGSSILGETA